MKRLAFCIATCCGVGYIPWAPGTAGAAAGVILVLFLAPCPWAYALVFALIFSAGVWSGTVVERHLGVKDPSRIVIDEAMSSMITFAGVPLTGGTLLLGCALNRMLDILKPFPARAAQDAPGGWGVMLDDLISGIYSAIALRTVIALWGRL